MPSKNILSPLQIKLIQAIAQGRLAKLYYWTGGTALAYKYLGNRLSEDLDFFSGDLLRDEDLLVELERLKKSLKIKKIKLVRELNRQQFGLAFGRGQNLKLGFVFFPFKNLARPIMDKKLGMRVDSLVDMAANKTLAAWQRHEPKDVFDLYSLLTIKKMKLSELIKKVNKKFGVQIDEADLGAKILDNINLLKSIRPLVLNSKEFDIKKIRNFFSSQSINYLKNHIF